MIYRETIQKKIFMTQIIMMYDHSPRARHPGMWSHMNLRKNHYEQSSGGDGIAVEPFQILKYDAVKMLHSIWQYIWKTEQWPQDWERWTFIPISKKGNAKECSNDCTIAVISHASKVMFKLYKPGFKSTQTMNFLMFKLDLEKAEESEIKLSTSVETSKKQENTRNTSNSALLTLGFNCGFIPTSACGLSIGVLSWAYPGGVGSAPVRATCGGVTGVLAAPCTQGSWWLGRQEI